MLSHSERFHIQTPHCSCHSFVRVSLIPSSWLCFSWKKVYPGPGRYPSCSSTHTLKMLLLLWYWFLPWPPSWVKSLTMLIAGQPVILFTGDCSKVAMRGALASGQPSPDCPRLSTSCKKLPRPWAAIYHLHTGNPVHWVRVSAHLQQSNVVWAVSLQQISPGRPRLPRPIALLPYQHLARSFQDSTVSNF